MGKKRRKLHLANVLLPSVIQTFLCSTLLKSCSTTEDSKVGQYIATERKLKDAMEKLTLQHGVTLEPQMNDDLMTIKEEMSEKVQKINLEQSFR